MNGKLKYKQHGVGRATLGMCRLRAVWRETFCFPRPIAQVNHKNAIFDEKLVKQVVTADNGSGVLISLRWASCITSYQTML